MNLTPEQIAEIVSLVVNSPDKKPIDIVVNWLKDKGLAQSLRPFDVMPQLSTDATFMTFATNRIIGNAIEAFCGVEGLTVDMVDRIVDSVTDASVSLQAKRSQLVAGQS